MKTAFTLLLLVCLLGCGKKEQGKAAPLTFEHKVKHLSFGSDKGVGLSAYDCSEAPFSSDEDRVIYCNGRVDSYEYGNRAAPAKPSEGKQKAECWATFEGEDDPIRVQHCRDSHGVEYKTARPVAHLVAPVQKPKDEQLSQPICGECKESLVHITMCGGATICVPDTLGMMGDVKQLCRDGKPTADEKYIRNVLYGPPDKCSEKWDQIAITSEPVLFEGKRKHKVQEHITNNIGGGSVGSGQNFLRIDPNGGPAPIPDEHVAFSNGDTGPEGQQFFGISGVGHAGNEKDITYPGVPDLKEEIAKAHDKMVPSFKYDDPNRECELVFDYEIKTYSSGQTIYKKINPFCIGPKDHPPATKDVQRGAQALTKAHRDMQLAGAVPCKPAATDPSCQKIVMWDEVNGQSEEWWNIDATEDYKNMHKTNSSAAPAPAPKDVRKDEPPVNLIVTPLVCWDDPKKQTTECTSFNPFDPQQLGEWIHKNCKPVGQEIHCEGK